MNDEQKPAKPSRTWLQISLSTILALVLGFGAGLAVKHQFGEPPPPATNGLPDPSSIRLGDKITLEVTVLLPGNVPQEPKRTVLVLADGTVTLPNLGQVPAAGLSLDKLTADLQQRYVAYYRTPVVQIPKVRIFVSFADSSVPN